MNKKSKFITAGIGALVLGLCLIYLGKTDAIYSASLDTNDNMVIFGTVLLVAGVVVSTIGFTIKAD